MADIKKIDDQLSVSPQLRSEDIAGLKAAGFALLINNRPDGEDAAQTAGAEIERAAKQAGLAYLAIPLGRDGVRDELVEATRKALAGAPGPVLAYCRSGTRSTTLWALSQAGQQPTEDIIEKAAAAGYDISHLRGRLDAGY